jgi:hypothetical protein
MPAKTPAKRPQSRKKPPAKRPSSGRPASTAPRPSAAIGRPGVSDMSVPLSQEALAMTSGIGAPGPVVILPAQTRVGDLGPEMEKMASENVDLRRQVEVLSRQGVLADLKVGEVEALLRKAQRQILRNAKELVSVADVLRSTSITAHAADRHGGSYDNCQHPHCAAAAGLWDEVGGIEGYQEAMRDPQAWVDRRMGVTGMTADVVVEDDDIPLEVESELEPDEDRAPAPPVMISGQTLKVDPVDMGWDPKYRDSTRARVLRVPPPEKDRDHDDPGPLKDLKM